MVDRSILIKLYIWQSRWQAEDRDLSPPRKVDGICHKLRGHNNIMTLYLISKWSLNLSNLNQFHDTNYILLFVGWNYMVIFKCTRKKKNPENMNILFQGKEKQQRIIYIIYVILNKCNYKGVSRNFYVFLKLLTHPIN